MPEEQATTQQQPEEPKRKRKRSPPKPKVPAWPDYRVAALSQLSNLSGVSFEDRYGSTFRGTVQDLSTTYALPMTLLATDAGYRIHADHIPPNSSLRIVMALVSMKASGPKDNAVLSRMFAEAVPCDFSIEQSLRDKITGGRKQVLVRMR